MREQVISLRQGWNAVFVEVAPEKPEPATLFAGTPIEVAAAYFSNVTPVQYLRDPHEAPWKEPGWNVWYAPDRPDAVVTDLSAIHGQRAYLLYSREAFEWRVTGRTEGRRIGWVPDSFNFIGFPVRADSPPTFAAYFDGSPAHRGQRVYTLENDRWKPVQNPAVQTVEAGHAYWVYCQGGSRYQGPLEVETPMGGALDFGASTGNLNLVFHNRTSEAVSVTVDLMNTDHLPPLTYVVRNLSTLETSYPRLPERLFMTPLAAGDSRPLTLQVRREAMSDSERAGLLRVTTDRGGLFWIPVTARRPSLVNLHTP